MPEIPWQMQDLPLMKFSRQFLSLTFPAGIAGKRLVDLGCLEGGYAVEFARDGFDTLGIEVRQSNFKNCQRVKAATNLPQAINLPHLSFVCGDVRNLENPGVFDAIFCCGILYHVDEPRKFMEQMSRVAVSLSIRMWLPNSQIVSSRSRK